jgi:hypothetical protein
MQCCFSAQSSGNVRIIAAIAFVSAIRVDASVIAAAAILVVVASGHLIISNGAVTALTLVLVGQQGSSAHSAVGTTHGCVITPSGETYERHGDCS